MLASEHIPCNCIAYRMHHAELYNPTTPDGVADGYAVKSSIMFSEDLSRAAFASLLQSRFQYMPDPAIEDIQAIDDTLGCLPVSGHPVDVNKIALFQHCDRQREHGVTIENAVVHAMTEFPDVEPRRRRTQKVAGHTDPDHVKEMLIAEYKRYLSRKRHGLDPAVQYSTNLFFDFLLTKQWDRAAAVFCKANKQRRLDLCERLNKIALKNTE